MSAYRARVPVPAFRAILERAWEHDHREVQRAAGHKNETMRKWFVYAAFDVSQIPETVTLYRGGLCFLKDDDRWQAPRSLCWGPLGRCTAMSRAFSRRFILNTLRLYPMLTRARVGLGAAPLCAR